MARYLVRMQSIELARGWSKSVKKPNQQKVSRIARFQILLSDGAVESLYQTPPIPKLYVIDVEGNIRFRHNGYYKDGYYLKKLDWMIEAAMKYRSGDEVETRRLRLWKECRRSNWR